MPTYFFQVKYTDTGSQGLLRDGGSGREKALSQLFESMGGTLEHIFFSGNEILVIAQVPGLASVTAMSLTVMSGGAVEFTQIKEVLTVGEMDAAMKLSLEYRGVGE